MKKNFLLFLSILLGIGSLDAAPKLGIGSDQPDEVAAVLEQKTILDNHTRALEFYIAGLKESSPAARILHLLKAAALDPQRELPFLLLVKTLDAAPASIPMVKKRVDAIKKDHPQNLFIALQSVRIDRRAGVAPETIVKNILPLLKTPPARKVEKHFNSLAFEYIDLLLKTSAPTQILPYETKSLFLQETALLYYSVAYRRDRLSLLSSAAAGKLQEARALLAGAVFKNTAELRRHLAVLTLAKEQKLALQAAQKRYALNPDPLAGLLLVEAASNAGEISVLENVLKKYPALQVEFCAQKRLQCYQQRGDWQKAREELVHLTSPALRREKGLTLAQQMRDNKEAKRLLQLIEKDSRHNKIVLALGYLSLAENARDAQAFKHGKQLLGTSYMQNPMLANAVGYVGIFAGGDLTESEMLLEFALSREPRNAAYLDSMAWIKYHRRDYKAAWEYIQKAFRCLDNSISGAVMAEHAGDICRALGDMTKARQYYLLAETLYNEDKSSNADLNLAELRQKIKRYCK